MIANLISIGRVILAFVTLGLFGINFYCASVAAGLTILVIYLDSLDGYIARKRGETSDFGALLDITGDRIVENIYWIFFTAMGLISFWVPVIVVTRSMMVDIVRTRAFAEGKTPFGKKTMMKSGFTRLLTASPVSRTGYALAKAFAFCFLGVQLALQRGIGAGILSLESGVVSSVASIAIILVYVSLALCVIRGLPVLWDGKEYIVRKPVSA